MKRRFALYLSAAAPAVAAVTVVGTGVSQAEVSRVSPGPRILADAAPSQAPAPEATHRRHATTHRTRPVVHLACHETDKPAIGPAPTAGTGPANQSSASSSSTTNETDSVVCHWSHVRRHLKVGSFQLLRSAGGSGSPTPAVTQSFGAKTRDFTDTSVTDGTSYAYVLRVLGPDGSQVGTSNTVRVQDGDDEANPGATPSESETGQGGRTTSTNSSQPDHPATAGASATPDSRTALRSHPPMSGGAGRANQHHGASRHGGHPNVSRPQPVSTD